MSYKRVVQKRGKTYGPYVYESYRDKDGKVQKRYLGKFEEKKKSKVVFTSLLFVLLVLVSCTTIFYMGETGTLTKIFHSIGDFADSFSSPKLSGHLSLEIDDSSLGGDTLGGLLELSLKEGELIPGESKVVVEQLGETTEYFFKDFVELNSNGTYYIEGKDISGEGKGYGFISEKTFYPEVYFTLLLEDGKKDKKEKEPNKNETKEDVGVITEEPGETNETVLGELEEELEESVEAIEDEEVEVIEPEEEEQEEVEDVEPTEEQGGEDVGGGITGGVVKEILDEVEGSCSKGNPFEYSLDGQSAIIKPNSIHLEDGGEVDLSLDVDTNEEGVVVSTSYEVVKGGFGEDYILDEIHSLEISLDNLDISVSEGTLEISLIYDGETLASVSKEITPTGEILPIEKNITEIVSNLTNATEPEEEINITIFGEEAGVAIQYKAVINRPVKWLKKVRVNSTGLGEDTLVEIPKTSENISVKTGEEISAAESEIDEYENTLDGVDRGDIVDGTITGFVSRDISKEKGIITRFVDWIKSFTISGKVISELDLGEEIIETPTSKIVNLTSVVEQQQIQTGEEVAVEYYTEAPQSNETLLLGNSGKRVVVHASTELNYTEILAYSLINESVYGKIPVGSSKLKLYWYAPVEENVTDVEEKEKDKKPKKNKTEEESVVEDVGSLLTGEIVVDIDEKEKDKKPKKNKTEEEVEAIGEEKETNETVVESNETTEQKTPIEINETADVEEAIIENLTKVVGELLNVTLTPTLDGRRMEVNYSGYDLDEDGYVDYIGWVVPHLSARAYEIVIEITKADHLDENRTFVEDVYDYVKAKDDNWTTIPDGHYVRVEFEQELNNEKDITLYARANNWANLSAEVEVYEKDGNVTLATFENVSSEDWHKIYLKELNGTQGVFDLRSMGDVDYDYIVDPVVAEDVPAGYNLANDSEDFGIMEALNSTSDSGAAYVGRKLADNILAGESTYQWRSASGQITDQNITINFTDAYAFDTIEFNAHGYDDIRAPNNTNIYVSDDAQSWTNIWSGQAFEAIPTLIYGYNRINFTEQTKRYITIEFLDNWGDTSYIALGDLRIYKNTTNLANESSTTVDGHGLTHELTDDLYADYWQSDSIPDNVTLDFGSVKTFELVEIMQSSSGTYSADNFTLWVSKDDITYTKVDDFSFLIQGISGFTEQFNFTEQNARYLKFEFLDDLGAGTITLKEIRVWGTDFNLDVPTGHNLVNDTQTLGTLEAITATSTVGGNYVPELLADGQGGATTGNGWFSASGQITDQNITINFTDAYDFNMIRFHGGSTTETRTPNNTNIWVSDDCQTWIQVGGTTSLFGGKVPSVEWHAFAINFAKQTKRYVRLEFLDNMGASDYMALSELVIRQNTTNLANLTTTTITTTADAGDAYKLGDEDWYTYTWQTIGLANVTLDFGSAKDVESMFYSAIFGEAANYSVHKSSDGTVWTSVTTGTFSNQIAKMSDINFTKQTTRYLQFRIEDTYDNTVSIAEIEVWEVEATDSTPPTFSDSTPQNQTRTQIQSLDYDINATDETGFDTFAVNWTTNFTINDSGWLDNSSVMPAGIYWMNITINDTANNVNSTIMFVNVTVRDATLPLINFTDPTPPNVSTRATGDIYVNVSVVNDSVGEDMYAFIDFDKSLVGWWRGENVATDESGYGHDLTLYNDVTYASGKFNQSFVFGGDEDYLKQTSSDFDDLINDSFTVSTWLNLTPESNAIQNQEFFDKWAGSNIIYCRVTINTGVVYCYGYDGTTAFSITGTTAIDDSKWHHVVYSFNREEGAGHNSTLYIDGSPEKTQNTTTVIDIRSTADIVIGADVVVTANEFNGSIDDYMIFSRALSNEEVLALYNASVNKLYKNFTGLSDSVHTFNAYAVDSFANLNSTGQRNVTIRDLAFPLINFTDPTPSNFSTRITGDIYVNLSVVNDTAGEDMYAFINFDRSLVGWWRGENVATDESGYGNDGSLEANANATSPGIFNQSFGLDGVNDYVDFGDIQAIDDNDEISVSAWVYHFTITGDDCIFCKAAAATDGILFFRDDAGASGRNDQYKAFVADSTDTSTAYVETAASSSPQNTWTHVVMTYKRDDAAGLKVYINGVEDANSGVSTTEIAAHDAGVNALRVGVDSASARDFDGYVDDLMVFNRTLNLQEIKALYNASVNKLYRNFTGLSDSVHTFNSHAVDSSANLNSTGQRNVTIELGEGNVTACRVFDVENGEYNLSANIIDNGLTADCITITASNITLDCKGFYIMSDDSYTGIYSDQANTKIRGCNVSMGTDAGGMGIELAGAHSSYIYNNTLNSQYYGLSLLITQHVIVHNITASSNSNSGIYIDTSTNNTFENVSADSNLYGVYFDTSDDNSFKGIFAGSSGEIGAFFVTGSDDNVLRDGTLSGSTADVRLDETQNTNNTFLNMTYSSENVYADSVLIRKWYLQTKINDSSTNVGIENANVTAWNSTGDLIFSNMTNATGMLTKKNIIQYINSSGTTEHYTPYVINVTYLGHHTNKTSLAMTTNRVHNVSLIEDIKPFINFTDPTPPNVSARTTNDIYVNVSVVNDSVGEDMYAFINFDKSLVGWWRGENVATDESGYGNDGSLEGGATYDSGRFNQTFSFDGDNDYVDVAGLAGESISEGTLSFWFKPNWNSGDSAKHSLFDWQTDSTHYFRGEHYSDNNWYIGWNNGVGDRVVVSSETMSVSSGNWYHLTFMWDDASDVERLYLDGVEKGSVTDSVSTLSPAGNFMIARIDVSTDVWFNGTIDEVMVFNRSLDPVEIATLYNASVNKLYKNFTGLSDSFHTFNAYAVDSSANLNSTGQRNVSVEVGEGSVTTCREFDVENGEYYLSANIIDNDLSADCITITAKNITLDCKGYYIMSDDVYTGVYSNQSNTTIKNCNISMPNQEGGIGIELVSANNSEIYNNTLSSQFYGLYSNSAHNLIIKNITANSNQQGIYLSSSSNNTLTNITSNSNIFGIYLSSSSNNTLTNITSNSNNDGIHLTSSSNNNILTNITSSSNNEDGISLSSSSNNTLTNITANVNDYFGISLSSSSNNNLTNINASSNGEIGIKLVSDSDNNTLKDIAASSFEFGIYLSSSSNNILTNTTTNSAIYQGIRLTSSSNNNTFRDIVSNSNNYGIQLSSSSNNNTFTNGELSGNTDVDVLSQSSNNSLLLNITYASENVSNGTLTRRWHLQTKINDSSTNVGIENANVTAWNSTGDLIFSNMTNATGMLAKKNVTQYINNSGTTEHYTPYVINVTYLGYHTNKTSLAMTTNRVHNVSLIEDINPFINFTYPTPSNVSTRTTNDIYVNLSVINDSVGEDMYAFINFDRSLVGWWRAENVATDESGYGNDGTLEGGATYASGRFNQTFSFDGDGDFIGVADDDSLDFDDGNFTISSWIKWDDGVDSTETILKKDGNYIFRISSNDLQGYSWSSAGSDQRTNLAYAANLNTGQWYHLVLVGTYPYANAKLYIDGVEKTWIVTTTTSARNLGYAISIGGTPFGGEDYDGSIDEVMIFNRSLDSVEIATLYNASVNKLYKNFTGLSDSVHTFNAYAVDSSANLNSTGQRNVTVESGEGNVTECRELGVENGEYNLSANIIDNGLTADCITITAKNITLDCKGFYIMSDDSYTGVYSNQLNTTIKNCNISMGAGSGGYGVELVSANNSYVYNNTLSSQSYGAYLYKVYNSTIKNIIANSNGFDGIYLSSSSNNNLTNITANSNNRGVLVYASSNNNLTNITANSNTNGIEFSTASNNNRFNDVTISSSVAKGIYMTSDNDNNIFEDIISESNGVWGIYLVDSNDNNTFIDGNLSENTPGDVFFGGVVDNLANTFLNITYASENVSAGTLIRRWYLQTKINDSSTNVGIENANVTAWNSTGDLIFSNMTNATGMLAKKNIIQYINNSGTTEHYTPYVINVSATGYYTNSTSLAITNNSVHSVKIGAYPTGLCDEGDTETTCNITTIHMNISDAVVLSYNNIIVKNGGSLGNRTANCSASSHGCGFVLNLTGNLTIQSGGNISVGNISISAESVDVQSGGMITVDGLGWMARMGPGYHTNAASHGGFSGVEANWSYVYGDERSPVTFGSGGWDTNGGGIIFINVTKNISVNGNISSSDKILSGFNGAAGGSVWLVANNISGSGGIYAKGGYGTVRNGGGGRIAFYATFSDFNGDISTEGGQFASVTLGRAGTFYFEPKNINLTVKHPIALAGGNYTFDVLNITNNAVLYIQANRTFIGNGTGVIINARDVYIESGSSIDGRGLGFGFKDGQGFDGNTGSYGGLGGSGTVSNIYGSETEPISLGSGSHDVAGGGALKINSSNLLLVNGDILFDGMPTDGYNGAAGGSVWLVANNLTLNENISVSGSCGTLRCGGGGRIALYADNLTFEGIIENKGLLTGSISSGSAGTIYINASESITSTGNITATGYNGSTAFINITDTLLSLSGIYNASSSVLPNGTITLNYTDCSSTLLITGTFLPDATYQTTCDYTAPTINTVIITDSVDGLGQTINITSNVTEGVQAVWVGVTVPGSSQANYTMINSTISDTFNYTYNNTWTNGSYSVVVYANDSLNNLGSNSSQSFKIYNNNITVQIRTLQDSYQNDTFINLTDPPGGSDVGELEELSGKMSNMLNEMAVAVSDEPDISNLYTDPTDVWPGDEMLVSADVSDSVGVKKVEVEMPYEKGLDVLDMELESGDKYDGTWQVVWDVHDTLEKNYTSIVRAENYDGKISEKEVGWSDSAVSIYNFSDLSNKKALCRLTGGQPPSNPGDANYYEWNSTSGCSNNYTKLADNDNDRDSDSLAGSPVFVNHWYNFTIAEDVSTMDSIEVKWVGYDELSQGDSFEFDIWNFSSGSWLVINTTSSGESSDINYGTTFDSTNNNLSEFIQGGSLHLGISGSYACFAGDTKISMTDGSYKEIGDIKIGDKVKSYDFEIDEVIDSTVTKVFHHSQEEMGDYYLILNLSDGLTIKVTPNHLVYINGVGWQQAGGLNVGDTLMDDQGNLIEVIAINKNYERIKTYNFEVEKYHVYFAGFLAHNAKPSQSPFVYSYSDSEYKFESDILGGFDSKPKEGIDTIRLHKIEWQKPIIKIANELKEIEYIDYLALNATYLNLTDNSEFSIVKELISLSGFDINKVKEVDEDYIVLYEGDETIVELENLGIEGIKIVSKDLIASGYYGKLEGWMPGNHTHGTLYTNYVEVKITYSSSSITYDEFSGNGETTNLSALDLTENTAVSDLVLDDVVTGKIKFLEDVTINDTFDLDASIDFSSNNISVNSTAYAGAFNKSAEITMYGLTRYGYPKILKDGVECSAPDCNILSWDNSIGQLVFNVTSFSGYSAAEANQSKVQNNGTYNISFYLLMKTQFYNAGWQDEDIVINDSATSTLRTVYQNATNILKLDTLWNVEYYNSSNLSSGDGTYRVYVALQDDVGNVLTDSAGDSLSAGFNFTLDNVVPSTIVLNAPADDAYIADTANDVSFNWTATDAIDSSLTCNLTVDSVVEGMNLASVSGGMTNYTVNALAVGDHEWNVTCWDDAMNVNTSLSWNVSIYVSNTAPNNPTVSINSTDHSNKTAQDLNCFATITDPDANDMNVSVRWYKAGELNLTLNYDNSYANGTVFNSSLRYTNTTKDDVWICSLRLYDGAEYSDWVNSTSLTILNTLPTVELSNPSDDEVTTTRAPAFSWVGTDDDGETISYQINISLVATSTCSDIDELENLTADSYTPTYPLSCISDNRDYYIWNVRANDSTGCGSWTAERKLNISALLTVSLPVSSVEFGMKNVSYNLPYQDNTTDDSPLPLKLQNDGNVLANITLNATSLFQTFPEASNYYRFKIDTSDEAGSFNSGLSLTSWNQMVINPSTIVGIAELNHTNSTDSAEIDIHIQVPPNEHPGVRNTSVSFTASLGE